MARLRPALFPLLGGGAFLLLWYAVHGALSEDARFFLPTPGQVGHALATEAGSLAHAARNTAIGALWGFGLAIIVSALLGVLLSLAPWVRATLYPYLMMLQMTPVIVFAPILILWVGPGLKSVVIVTFLICFFPLVVNTTQGLVSTDAPLRELFRSWRATRAQELWHLRIPAALPYFFTGLRIAATLAPIGALVGDYTAGTSAGDGGGLGFSTIIYSTRAMYPALFATALVTCGLGFVFTAAVLVLNWWALHRWHDTFKSPPR